MIEFENTPISSAASVAAMKPARTSKIVEVEAAGVAIHNAASPQTKTSDRAAIHGLRRPRPSASAPRNGLMMAISKPATAAA